MYLYTIPVYPLLQNRTKRDSCWSKNPVKVSFQHQIGMTRSQRNPKGNYLWFVFRRCLLGISMALTCKGQEPPMIPAWMATPVTTARSGSMDVLGSFPKYSLISLLIRGILVEPPTSTISSTSPFSRWPSAKTVSTGVRIFWKRSSLISSNTCRVISVWKRTEVALGPSPPELRFAWRCSGTLIVTLGWKVRLILADSTACLRWWMSSVRVGGIPNFCRTCSVVFCSNLWLKSWPPSLLFPAEKKAHKTRCFQRGVNYMDPSGLGRQAAREGRTRTCSWFFISRLSSINALPAMALVRNMPPCLLSSETSRVPPPRSTTSTLKTSILCSP